jgi:outer membrane biosynthesis protein TonB
LILLSSEITTKIILERNTMFAKLFGQEVEPATPEEKVEPATPEEKVEPATPEEKVEPVTPEDKIEKIECYCPNTNHNHDTGNYLRK